ncbi:endo-1,4-beta-xylanase [Pseudarthrobacter sp. C4D7]|uniref:endo-1,4-beta-xylanase n=1 Tax=Pseudarthrobacter sp. C4D7 TaxID=2735268 RepID=UPI00158568A8|nr:endo-1,4-beta-xylanase [Pseudarthrobacter sp. C4D7]NUT69674.1 glycoside hydrolase [Pseudarthrobacter sp. C4D7]
MGGHRHALTVVLVSALLVILSSCTPPKPDVTLDLLDGDWQDVPGVRAAEGALQVTPTARRIVEQSGEGGQPNPPLNLAGTHLVVGGDFSLSATFAHVTADASWALYDRPPVIADEFRVEPAGLRLTLQGNDLRIAVFDGTQKKDVSQPKPVHEEHVTVKDPGAPLTVRRSGDSLAFSSGTGTLSTMPLGKVFSSGELWLGFSSESGDFDITTLTAVAPGNTGLRTSGAAVADLQPSKDGLQALAARTRPDFLMGAAVALGPLTGDADYAREFVGNFGALTPENAMKPQFLSPQQGVYTFEEADAILTIARSKGIAVHGHTIAFTEAMPRWMQDLPAGSEAERRASGAALLDYIATVVGHFKGRLASLDVVNEPFDVDQGTSMQQNIWYRVFGPGYPAVVSKAVYAADPDVKQYINENGADVPGRRQDALLKLILDANAQGGHIYGAGLQAHVYDLGTDAITADGLSRTLKHFGDAGLRVRISENDVTDDHGTEAQAEQYAAVVSTCLRSRSCISYTTWGVDDRYDWWIDDGGTLQQGHDHLFNNGKPTPAYDAVKRALGG